MDEGLGGDCSAHRSSFCKTVSSSGKWGKLRCPPGKGRGLDAARKASSTDPRSVLSTGGLTRLPRPRAQASQPPDGHHVHLAVVTGSRGRPRDKDAGGRWESWGGAVMGVPGPCGSQDSPQPGGRGGLPRGGGGVEVRPDGRRVQVVGEPLGGGSGPATGADLEGSVHL